MIINLKCPHCDHPLKHPILGYKSSRGFYQCDPENGCGGWLMVNVTASEPKVETLKVTIEERK